MISAGARRGTVVATQTGICVACRLLSLSWLSALKRTVYQPWERPLQLFLLKRQKEKERRDNREKSDPAAVLSTRTHTQKRSSCRDSFRLLLSREQLFSSEAKSWRCNAPAAHYIPALRREKLLHMIACQWRMTNVSDWMGNIFTFMHLADAFIQSDLQCIQAIQFFLVSIYIYIYIYIIKTNKTNKRAIIVSAVASLG